MFPSNKMRVIAGDLSRMRVKASENFQCRWKYSNEDVTRQIQVTWHIWISNNSAPIKRKTFHFNLNQFMWKTLRKVVTTWSRLKNKFNERHRKMIAVTIKKKESLNTLCKAKRKYRTKHSNLRNRTKSISRKYHRHFLKSWKYSED